MKLSSSLARGVTTALSKTVESVANIFRQKPRYVEGPRSKSVGRLQLPRVNLERLSQNPHRSENASRAPPVNSTAQPKSKPQLDKEHRLLTSENGGIKGETIASDIPEASSLEVSDYLSASANGEDWWKEEPSVVQSTRPSKMKDHWTAVLIGSASFLVLAAIVTFFPRNPMFISDTADSIKAGFTNMSNRVAVIHFKP